PCSRGQLSDALGHRRPAPPGSRQGRVPPRLRRRPAPPALASRPRGRFPRPFPPPTARGCVVRLRSGSVYPHQAERLAEALDRGSLDALVAASPANVAYVSGFHRMGPDGGPALAVFARQGTALLV